MLRFKFNNLLELNKLVSLTKKKKNKKTKTKKKQTNKKKTNKKKTNKKKKQKSCTYLKASRKNFLPSRTSFEVQWPQRHKIIHLIPSVHRGQMKGNTKRSNGG